MMNKNNVIGKNLADCKNVLSCSMGAVQNLLAYIPVWEHENYTKQFKDVGGVEYVLLVAGASVGLLAPQNGVVTDAMKTVMHDWYGASLEPSLKEIGDQAMVMNPTPKNKYNQSITFADLFFIASQFGFDSNGFLNVFDFVYFRPKRRFLSIHNPSSLYDAKTIQTDALPVLVDPLHRFWADADEYGIQNLYVDDVIFDPLYPSGRISNKACDSGEIIEAIGHAILNTYHPPLCSIGNYVEDTPDLFVKPFLNHLHNLLRKEDDAKTLLQWCAHIIQKPGEKVRWAPILYSLDQGVGKDTIINFIEEIVGKRYCSTIKPSEIGGNFNEWAQSILIRISEVSDVSEKSSRRKFQEEVKTIISGDDKFVTINEKYGLKHNARNIAHVIITTNNPQDIAVSEEDRRYDVMECATKLEMNIVNPDTRQQYFNDLYSWYENGGKENLYAYLLHVDLSDFKPTVPRLTQAKVSMQQSSMDYLNWINDVLDVITEHQEDVKDKVFRSDTFIALAKGMSNNLPQWSGPESNKISAMFRNNIAKFKYQQIKGNGPDGRITVGNGKKAVIYCRNYNTKNLSIDKKNLLAPEQVPDLIDLLMPHKESFKGFSNPYSPYS